MKVFGVPVVLLCLACLLKPSYGVAVFGGLKRTDLTLQRALNQQQQPLEMVTIADLSYRLDLVDCPRAVPVAGSIATYRTRLSYVKDINNFICVVRDKDILETIPLQLNEDNEVIVLQEYTQGIVQRIMYTCPKYQRGEVDSLSIDLPSPKLLGTDEECIDSLLFSQDGSSDITCQLCGSDSPSIGRNTDSTCWNRVFRDNLTVTFRSSNQELNGRSFMGFNLTIKCIPDSTMAPPTCHPILELQQENVVDPPQCLTEDFQLTTKEYFENQDPITGEDFKEYFKKLLETGTVSVIPNDAQDVLQTFALSSDSEILHLALLCEKSCDENLSAFATHIVNLINSK